MRRVLVLVLVVLLGSASVASAQVAAAVVEVGANLYQNTITAVEAVLQTANQFQELLPIDAMVLSGDFGSTLDAIDAVTREAGALSHDLASLQAQVTVLFGLEGVPHGSLALRQRQQEIRQVVWQAHTYALRTQTLINTTISTIGHIRGLTEAIMALMGNHQSNQTLIQVTATQAEILAKLQVTTTAAQRAESIRQLEAVVLQKGQQRVLEGVLADYPGGVPGVGQ